MDQPGTLYENFFSHKYKKKFFKLCGPTWDSCKRKKKIYEYMDTSIKKFSYNYKKNFLTIINKISSQL